MMVDQDWRMNAAACAAGALMALSTGGAAQAQLTAVDFDRGLTDAMDQIGATGSVVVDSVGESLVAEIDGFSVDADGFGLQLPPISISLTPSSATTYLVELDLPQSEILIAFPYEDVVVTVVDSVISGVWSTEMDGFKDLSIVLSDFLMTEVDDPSGEGISANRIAFTLESLLGPQGRWDQVREIIVDGLSYMDPSDAAMTVGRLTLSADVTGYAAADPATRLAKTDLAGLIFGPASAIFDLDDADLGDFFSALAARVDGAGLMFRAEGDALPGPLQLLMGMGVGSSTDAFQIGVALDGLRGDDASLAVSIERRGDLDGDVGLLPPGVAPLTPTEERLRFTLSGFPLQRVLARLPAAGGGPWSFFNASAEILFAEPFPPFRGELHEMHVEAEAIGLDGTGEFDWRPASPFLVEGQLDLAFAGFDGLYAMLDDLPPGMLDRATLDEVTALGEVAEAVNGRSVHLFAVRLEPDGPLTVNGRDAFEIPALIPLFQ